MCTSKEFGPSIVFCSYERIQPNTWSGAYKCWGRDNREAPLRTASPPGCDADMVSNFELKSFDGCANPHLGLAAIIAAGMDGLRNHYPLPEPVGESLFILWSCGKSIIQTGLNFYR